MNKVLNEINEKSDKSIKDNEYTQSLVYQHHE